MDTGQVPADNDSAAPVTAVRRPLARSRGPSDSSHHLSNQLPPPPESLTPAAGFRPDITDSAVMSLTLERVATRVCGWARRARDGAAGGDSHGITRGATPRVGRSVGRIFWRRVVDRIHELRDRSDWFKPQADPNARSQITELSTGTQSQNKSQSPTSKLGYTYHVRV